MSILDTFISVFTADTDGLKDGQDKATKSTNELVESMRKAEKQSEALHNKMIGLAKGAAGFLAAAFSVSKLAGISSEQANVINNMRQTSEAIGIAVGDMDAFNKAMGDSSATAEAAEASLMGVFRAAGAAASDATGMQAKAFEELGVSIYDGSGQIKNSIELMQDLAGSVEGLDKATAINIFKKLGVTDRRVVEQLLQGRRALDDQMRAHKAAGVITKEQAELAARYSDAQTKLSNSMNRGAREVMQFFLPAMTFVIGKLSDLVDWAVENKHFVIGFFTAIATVVSLYYIPIMYKAAAATIAATWPFIFAAAAITAIGVAIGLLVDDIANWLAGNDSLIGDLIEKYPIIGDIIQGIIAAVKSLWDWILKLGDMAAGAVDWIIGKTTDLAQAWVRMVDSMVGKISSGFSYMKEIVTSVIGWIMDKINAVTGSISKVAGFFGLGGSKVELDAEQNITSSVSSTADPLRDFSQQEIQLAQAYLDSASASPLNSVSSQVLSNHATTTNARTDNTVNIGELKVETQATDAKGVAAGARSELKEQLKNLNYESASGVAR